MGHPSKFSDLEEAAHALIEVLPEEVIDETELVLALGTPARGVAEPIARNMGVESDVLDIERGESPVVLALPTIMSATSPRNILVVDCGVETGQSAGLAARVLRDAGAQRLVLAVPVCPRQAESGLALVYDGVIAVHRPLARRSLQWHYSAPLE